MPISLSGSLNLSGSLTTTGTITATTLVVQTITSSISSITGSTNFGSLSSNTHTFTGSMFVTGSGAFLGSVSAGTNFRLGNASYGQIAIIDGSGGFGGGYNFNLNSGTPQHDSTGAMAAYYYDSSGNIRFFASSSQVSGTSAQERMRITPTGNVGIGTSSPSSYSSPANQLVVGTNSGNNGITIAGGTTGLSSIYFADGTTGNEAYRGYFEYGHTSDYMAFGTAATERMRILSTGNVGIGTVSPGSKLEVYGSAQNSPDTSNAIFKVNSTSTNALVMGTLASTPYGCYIQSGGSGTYPLVLNPNGGAVLVNVVSSANASAARGLVSTNGSSTAMFELMIGGAEYGYVYHGGSNGNMYFNNSRTNATTYVISSGNGVYLATNATSWTSNSDERLKTINSNIENALDKLLTLRAVNFSWISDETNKENLGLIAQDVEKVFPQVIDKNKLSSKPNQEEIDETEYLGVRYQELVPVLVKAIQELTARVQYLENK